MKVIITTLPEKLPENVRELIDESRPLPAEASFFEERFTLGRTIYWLAIGIVLVVIGVILLVVGVLDLVRAKFFVPLLAGVVCIFGGYLLISSLKARIRQMREQQRGAVTRYGIFLVNDLLICRSWFDTTIIPRPLFKGLRGRAVHYDLEGAAKSFDLPSAIVGKQVREMDEAIEQWAMRSQGASS